MFWTTYNNIHPPLILVLQTWQSRERGYFHLFQMQKPHTHAALMAEDSHKYTVLLPHAHSEDHSRFIRPMTNNSMRCLERQDKATQHNRKTKQHNKPSQSSHLSTCTCTYTYPCLWPSLQSRPSPSIWISDRILGNNNPNIYKLLQSYYAERLKRPSDDCSDSVRLVTGLCTDIRSIEIGNFPCQDSHYRL